jgi:hypothetical protein
VRPNASLRFRDEIVPLAWACFCFLTREWQPSVDAYLGFTVDLPRDKFEEGPFRGAPSPASGLESDRALNAGPCWAFSFPPCFARLCVSPDLSGSKRVPTVESGPEGTTDKSLTL